MRRGSEVVRVDPSRPDLEAIERAAGILRSGGLVALPTETVYGLGADAGNVDAVESIFVAKGRPSTDPLIVHVPDHTGARAVCGQWDERASRLAERFWPGPLTLVLPRGDLVVAQVSAGLDTVAVRVPAHPVAAAVLVAAGCPVAAPSANRFGRISPTDADHVVEELDGHFDLLLDAGPCPLGVESTVLDLTSATPRLLRPGGIALEQLQSLLGEVHHEPRVVTEDGAAARAPGQLLGHYAPVTTTVLVDGDPALVLQLERGLTARGVRVAVVELDADPALAASSLYRVLREADGLHAELLLVRVVDPAGIGRAVNDRLFRSAHGRVVLDASTATLDRLVRAGGR